MNTLMGYMTFANMLLNLVQLGLELSQDGTFNNGRFSAALGWFVAWLSYFGKNEN